MDLWEQGIVGAVLGLQNSLLRGLGLSATVKPID